MFRTKLLTSAAAVAALALAACDARTGNGADANRSAEGKAEEGRLTVHTPGMDLKVNIPAPLRRGAGMHSEGDLVYPGSTMAGVHVESGPDQGEGRSQGGVELTFHSADAPDQVARWYRDPARARHFTIAAATRDGDAIDLSGTTRGENDPLRIHLAPRAGGGTDGRVAISHGG